MDLCESLGVLDFLCPRLAREPNKLFNAAPNPRILAQLPHMKDKIIDNGQLRLVKTLGTGVSAACYEARSTTNEDEVFAVKVIPRKNADEARHRRLLDCEIKMHQAALEKSNNHKNILHFVKTVEEDGLLYIIMEHCANGDLHASIANEDFQGKDAKIKDTFIQILDGLQAMHVAGIYHCDLKPKNVFLKSCGTPIIGDFGLSTDVQVIGKARRFGVGTKPYMSPELLRSIKPECQSHTLEQSDIWALGIILFNMVTGKHCWAEARMVNDHFRSYAKTPYDYFLRRFDITPEANDIFRSIFSLGASTRTTLADLRERVLKIESFGSGLERVRKKRPEAYGLRLDLEALVDFEPPKQLMERHQDKCTDATSESSSSPTLANLPARPTLAHSKAVKAPTPLRVPRRKRAAHAFVLPETPTSSDRETFSETEDTPETKTGSNGPTTPEESFSDKCSLNDPGGAEKCSGRQAAGVQGWAHAA